MQLLAPTVVRGIGDFTDGTHYCLLPEAVDMLRFLLF